MKPIKAWAIVDKKTGRLKVVGVGWYLIYKATENIISLSLHEEIRKVEIRVIE